MLEARKAIFDKPALNVDQQLNLLISRGLSINNEEKAKHYLKFIGYYRLSAYCLSFQDKNNKLPHYFKAGTTFNAVINLYVFDRKLRLLVMDAVERIEVALKATISNTLSEKYGTHWLTSPKPFRHENDYSEVIKNINKAINLAKEKEVFLNHYYGKYDNSKLPPSWITFEILSFGVASNMFKCLKPESKKLIADQFGLGDEVMQSWLHTLSYTRNLCAHHSRIWNRTFTIKPKIAKLYKQHLCKNDKFYAQAVVIEVFLKTINEDSHWSNKLEALIKEHPSVPIEEMAFPNNWSNLSFWQTNAEGRA